MKTRPTGIRFEVEDLEFIKNRENLKTPQQVVNFLMSEYMKMYRTEKPSVFAYEKKTIRQFKINEPFDAPKKEEVINEAKTMPAGLSLAEQIEWRMNH